jgi:hypothetical protein
MSPFQDWGLDTTRLIAGFAGGVAHAFAFKQTQPLAQVSSVVVGTLCANYLGGLMSDAVQHYTGSVIGNPASGFLVGLTAMAIVQGFVSVVQSRIDAAKGVSKGDGK